MKKFKKRVKIFLPLFTAVVFSFSGLGLFLPSGNLEAIAVKTNENSLNLTSMCVEEELSDNKTKWRIYNDSGVDVNYRYKVAGSGHSGSGTIGSEHTKDQRFDDPYYFYVDRAHPVTVTIEWGDDFEYSKTKASGDKICEPEGSLTVCKMIMDEEENVVTDNDGLPDGDFEVEISSFMNFNDSEEVDFSSSTFYPNTTIFGSEDNAECKTINLDLGDYYYSEEDIVGDSWLEPLYNDQFQTPVESLDDFFSYSPELFDNGDPQDERNKDSDGHVTLTSNIPDRTLVLLNTYKPTFNLVAHKVVCDTEADLPDWAEGQNQPSEITQSLIVNYVNNSHGACYFEEDWEFEWAEEGTQKKPGAFTGQAGTGWTTFGPTTSGPTGMATTTIDYEDRDMIWVREVLKNGYIPFSDQNGGSESTSAELLCSIDGYNYDNYDRVDDPEVGETYYCVGFNVAEEGNNHTPRTSSGGGITLLQIKEEDEETPESDQPEESTPSENEEESEAPEDFIEGEILGSFIQRYQANKKCGPYLNEYIKAGAKNNPLEVLKLQLFLRDYLGINLPLNGIYGKDTVAALEEFQLMHKDEVLKPWVEAGVHENENTPTGYVYLTTQRWINMIMCPSLNLPKIDLSEYTAEVLLSPKLNINFDDMDSKEPEEGVEEIEVGSVEEDSNGLELLAGTVNDSETPTRLGTLLLAFLFVSIAGFMGYKAYHHHLVKR